jgi:yecA family protein
MDALAGVAMPTLDDMTGRSFALLDQAERDRLTPLLRPLPWLDGLIAAMVIAPDAPDAPDEMPAETDEQDETEGALDWLDVIWSEASEVKRLTLPQSMEAVTPVMDHYCHIANSLLDAPETYRPYLAGSGDPVEAAAQWADGFRVGITLEPDAWGSLFADEDAVSLLVVIFSLLREENMPAEMRTDSPFRDMPADRRDRMRRSAVDMLPEIVLALHDHVLGMSEGDDDEEADDLDPKMRA